MVVKLNVSCCLDINNQNKKNPGNSEMKRYLSIKQNKIIIKYILLIILLDFFTTAFYLLYLNINSIFQLSISRTCSQLLCWKYFTEDPPKNHLFYFIVCERQPVSLYHIFLPPALKNDGARTCSCRTRGERNCFVHLHPPNTHTHAHTHFTLRYPGCCQ